MKILEILVLCLGLGATLTIFVFICRLIYIFIKEFFKIEE